MINETRNLEQFISTFAFQLLTMSVVIPAVTFNLKVLIAFLIYSATVKSQLSPDPYCSTNRPTSYVPPTDCCSIPEFFDDADLVKCKNARGTENLFRTDDGRKKRFATSRMELGTCYLDCVFQAAGVTSSNGQLLDTNKLLRILINETPSEQESTNVIVSAVTQCISDLQSGTMRVRSPTVYNCSTIPSAIMMCIHKKFFERCPSNRFSNNQQCVQLRNYLIRCPVNI